MKKFLFKHREGQTPLPPDFQFDLIPKNIQTYSELNEHEEQNIALGLSWLEKQNAKVADHLFWRRLHKELFGNVWHWAGKARKKELQNDEFLSVSKIEKAIMQLEGDLTYWLENKEMSNKEIAARFHERMLTIHPFPNGNGRFTRILTSHICEKSGFPLPAWGERHTDQKIRRDHYVDAIVAARKSQNFKWLVEFMFS